MVRKHAIHVILLTCNAIYTKSTMLDRSSMVPKPQSFGITSKFHLPENSAKMKLTVDGEFSFGEKVDEHFVDHIYPPDPPVQSDLGSQQGFMVNAKVHGVRQHQHYETKP